MTGSTATPAPRGPRAVRRAAPADAPAETLASVLEELRESDRRVGRILALLQAAQDDDAAEVLEGLPLDHVLGLRGGRRRSEVNALLLAAEVLRHMPRLHERLCVGEISWAAVRSVAYEVRVLDRHQRYAVDQAIEDRYGHTAYEDVDPDRLVDEVTDAVLTLRPELERQRERRSFTGRRLVLQPYLDGSGGEIHGQYDAVGFATVDNALRSEMAYQLQTGQTKTDDGIEARRADALVGLAERTLAFGPGTDGGTRPKPIFHVLVEADALARGDGGMLLWNRPGRVPRLSRIAIEKLAQDADIDAVICRNGIPVAPAVDPQTIDPPAALRRRIHVRDAGRCRFPRCHRPADDLHHLQRRADGGAHVDHNVAGMCRFHNLLLERRRWKQRMLSDGTYVMSRPGRTYRTKPLRRGRLRPDGRPPTRGPGPP